MLKLLLGHDGERLLSLSFPIPPGSVGRRYREIENSLPADVPIIIHGAESSIQTLPERLKGMAVDERAVRTLECLAERINYLDTTEQKLFSAALECEAPESVKDILNISYNLDHYEFVTDHNGSGQTELKVLKPGGRRFIEVYDGEHLPEAGYDKNSVFLLYLYTGKKGYSLAVPATLEKMEMAKSALEVKNLNNCGMNQHGGPMSELWDYLPINGKLKEVNRIAAILKEKVLKGGQPTVKLLKAVLLAECPRTMKEATAVVRNLANYKLLENMQEPELYAREMIKARINPSLEPLLDRYVNWEALGTEMMSTDGAVQTEYGIVTSGQWCCERLSDEIVETRLFSQVTGELYDSEDYGESYDAFKMAWYVDSVQKAVKENWIFEQKKGLAEYIDNQLLKQRVIHMFPSVEVYDYNLWCALKVETRGELSSDEMEWVKEYWRGQASDGWGESFEQEDIECDDGCFLNVYFYNSSMLDGIRTEQELKGVERAQQSPQMGGLS